MSNKKHIRKVKRPTIVSNNDRKGQHHEFMISLVLPLSERMQTMSAVYNRSEGSISYEKWNFTDYQNIALVATMLMNKYNRGTMLSELSVGADKNYEKNKKHVEDIRHWALVEMSNSARENSVSKEWEQTEAELCYNVILYCAGLSIISNDKMNTWAIGAIAKADITNLVVQFLLHPEDLNEYVSNRIAAIVYRRAGFDGIDKLLEDYDLHASAIKIIECARRDGKRPIFPNYAVTELPLFQKKVD